MEISRTRRYISTASGTMFTTMSVVETVDCAGRRIKYEWEKNSNKLARIFDGNGRVAQRNGDHSWQIIDAESGIIEYIFDGDIRVNENGSLTVEQNFEPSHRCESITVSLDGSVMRMVSTPENNGAPHRFTQWSKLHLSRIRPVHQEWCRRAYD